MSFVYLLHSTNNATYVGATVNLERRLRQHNKEIKGGAHATSIKVDQGEIWERACYIEGFPTWQAALQFEWRWKQLSRKQSAKLFQLKRRMIALNELLNLERPTSKSSAYSEWSTKPNIIFESTKAEEFYNEILFISN